MNEPQRDAHRKGLAKLFSGYRAEWLSEEIFELFTEPSYFPQLTTAHPCFLVGGRGTGKTTVLRCLSYEGQAALHGGTTVDTSNWEYFGIYYRVNTNRVRAFGGPELGEATWTRMFGHYVNLELCEAIVQFLEWHAQHSQAGQALSPTALERISTALHLQVPRTQRELLQRIDRIKLEFEAAINNIADARQLPKLSLQGAPIDVLMEEVKALPQFGRKSFFFLIDEYENLDRTQQRILNTLIKHCGEFYSFKVGIRQLGLKERSTLSGTEQLRHPADYKLIDITDQLDLRFPEFAAAVCKRRLGQVLGDVSLAPEPTALLPGLSAEEEALELGVRDVVKAALDQRSVGEVDDRGFREWTTTVHPMEVFTFMKRAEAEGKTNGVKLSEILADRTKWKEQYNNHKHAYLFAIRRGKVGIRKHFAGWGVYCRLAGSNIRYLLELVDQALMCCAGSFNA